MMTNRFKRGSALLVALALAAAACGSDSDSAGETTSEGATETTAAAETTETTAAEEATDDSMADEDTDTDGAMAATGDPIQIGYLWSGVNPAVDNTSDIISARATVQWINEQGGGIGVDHRPIELLECATNSDASLAAACGSEFIDAGVPIILMNVSGEIEPWATPALANGIPIFTFSSADAALLADPELSSSMSNPVAGIAAFPATLAKTIGAERTTVVVIDVPAATGPAQALTPVVFEQADAGELHVLPISPTATDHSTDLQVELQTFDPDLVHFIGNPAFCTLGFRALRDAGYEGAIGGISNCIDDATIEALGADLEGIYLSYSAGEDPANADYAAWLGMLDQYAEEDIAPNGTPVGAYVVIESFRRFMEDYSGDFSATELAVHIDTHAPVPQPTIDGGMLVCDGTASSAAIVPNSCTPSFAYAQLDATGKPGAFTGAG